MRRPWFGFTLVLAALAACSAGDDPDSGTIDPGCDRTADCSGGLVCIAGGCKNPGSVTLNGECSATRDCSTGLYCEPIFSQCQPAGDKLLNAACAADFECTPGLRCDTNGVTGQCISDGLADVGAGCDVSSDCRAGLYCGASRECASFEEAFTPNSPVNCIPDSGPFKSYFEVPRSGFPRDFFRLPYPNDIRVSATSPRLDLTDFPRLGVGVLGVDIVDLYADTLVEDFDGFSDVAPVYFRFSAALDFGFLDAHAGGIKFVDLDTGEGLLGIGFGFGTGATRFSCGNLLTVYPATGSAPLIAGHTYAVVLVTEALRAQGGGPAVQDADLAIVLAATPPTDAAYTKAHGDYAKLRTWLGQNGIAAADVMNAAVFTVADPTATMRRLAAAVGAGPAPVLADLFQCGVTTGTDACDDGTEARRCGAVSPDFVEIHGKIRLPIFQSGTAPYLRPADGGGINLVGGNAVKVRDEEVCFALTMPTGTAPGAGWPLVVYGHGTGGSFRSFIRDGVAEALSKASTKMAVFSFDQVGHGARRGGSTRSPDELVFNVPNPRAARDNFLQGAADLLSAFRLPAATVPGTWTGPTLKFPAKVAYFGHSQGATHGALALPFTNDAGAAVMSGAGANLVTSLMNKTSPSNAKQALDFLLLDAVDGGHPMMTLWQQFFDRADPVSYNPLLIRAPVGGHIPTHVLMTWGTGDTFSPGFSLKWNAITSALVTTTPIIEDLQEFPGTVPRPISRTVNDTTTAVFIQYQPSGYDGHFVAWRHPDAARDVASFLSSFFASGTPVIP